MARNSLDRAEMLLCLSQAHLYEAVLSPINALFCIRRGLQRNLNITLYL